jgi:Cytochrome c7 and related cytochrome c/Class III cytochrome C family
MRSGVRAILFLAAAAVFTASSLPRSSAQGRVFSHNTAAHKTGKYASCSSCHTLPTKNWMSPRRDKQPPFPDVATFPSHISCFGCHTKDIYSNGGAFCGTCHTVPTMRARAVKDFPIRSHPSQFTTLFPHNVHQDLIAERQSEPLVAVAHFVNASFTFADEKTKAPVFYNCAICHSSTAETPKYVARKLPTLKPLADPVPDTFALPVTAEFFKDSPDGHASCFNCHYQFKNLPAEKQSCRACHELSTPYFEKKTIPRYSLKFDHQSPGHVKKDCTSCHLRITQNSDVRTMKDADVPILSCKECHAKQEDDPDKKALIDEIDKREASITDKKPAFQCTYCHTSAIGRYDIPESHRVQ